MAAPRAGLQVERQTVALERSKFRLVCEKMRINNLSPTKLQHKTQGNAVPLQERESLMLVSNGRDPTDLGRVDSPLGC